MPISTSLLRFSAIFGLVITALLTPIMVVDVPPLLDYPIHLARSYITLNHASDPDLAEIYQIDWKPIPNLASDLAIYTLGQFFGVELAGRIFLGTCVFLNVAGVIVLHRVLFQCWSYWPLMAVLPAYHGALMAGFINFSIGLALFPFGVALWIVLQDRSLILRLSAHCATILILYFCHILSVGLLGIVIGCYTIWRIIDLQFRQYFCRRSISELLIVAIPFIASAGFYVRNLFVEVTTRDQSILFGQWELAPKARGIMMPVLTHSLLLDCLTLVFLLGIPILLAFYRHLNFRPDLCAGAGLLFLLFIVLPGDLLDAGFIMERLPIAAVLIGIAAIQPRNLSGMAKAGLTVAVFALALTRIGVMSANWIESNDYYQRARIMAESIKRGSSVLVVSPFSNTDTKNLKLWRHRLLGYPNWHYALINIPNLHAFSILPITERGAFSQLHFLWPEKQILSVKGAYQKLGGGNGGSSVASPSEIFHFDQDGNPIIEFSNIAFDYVLIIYANHLPSGFIKEIHDHKPLYSDTDMFLLETRVAERTASDQANELMRLQLNLLNELAH